MATTWGQYTWGSNTWSSNLNTISVNGQAMSVSLNNSGITITNEVNVGWSSDSWGVENWGLSGQTVQPTGVLLTASVGDELIDTEINLGWGRLTWNENAWGIAGDVLLSGNSLTSVLGSPTIINEINTGWGSDGWGVEGWGASIQVVEPTGIQMTAFEGSAGLAFDGDANVTPPANALTIAQGDEEAFASFVAEPTGLPMTMNQTFDPEVVTLTGFALTATLGDESSAPNTIAEVNAFSPGYWGYRSTWGFSAWGNGQTNTLVMSMLENFSGADPAPDANPVGQAMAIALAAGDTFDIIGDANIAPLVAMGWGNGTWSESKWGNGVYRPDTDDIFTLTATLGTAVLDAVTLPTITGLGVQQVRLGSVSVTGEANVFPTGNNLTNSVGTATNVLIWNAVDTGSAPTTPPGWQEVPTNAA
jgi:hypothetical protein